jgi:translocation and assembly module TamA
MLFLGVLSPLHASEYHITVDGVDTDTKQNILKRLQFIHKAHSHSTPALHRAIRKETKLAMQPYGYFHPRLHIEQRLYRKRNLITLSITPGPTIKIQELTLKIQGPGHAHPSFKALLKQSKLQQGKTLRIPDYNQTKLGFFHIAEQLGFIDAKLAQHEIKLSPQQNDAEVTLIFNTGARYYFGPIVFTKLPLQKSLLRRYIDFKIGQPFSIQKLLALQDRLRSSGYFSNVKIVWQAKQAQHHRIPIRIELQPNKNKIYTLGLGYGTDTKIRGTVNFEKRYLNSHGHRLQTQLQASPVQSSLQARYIIPGPYPPTDEYQIFTSAVRYRLKQNDSFATVSGLSFQRSWKEWTQTIYLNYLIEWRRKQANSPALNSQWLYPSLSLRRIHAKDPITTRNGYRLKFNLQGAYDGIFAHDSFIKALFEFKNIRTFHRLRILTRGSLGVIGVSNINDLAAHFQFYTGGAQSIRGYKFQSIGPGKYLQVGSVELQFALNEDWHVGTFFDVGAAGKTLHQPWRRGIGINLIRKTPIGGVEIGLARPLDARHKSWNFIFNLGPDLA